MYDCPVTATTLTTELRPAYPAEPSSDAQQRRTAINIISVTKTDSATSSWPIERYKYICLNLSKFSLTDPT